MRHSALAALVKAEKSRRATSSFDFEEAPALFRPPARLEVEASSGP